MILQLSNGEFRRLDDKHLIRDFALLIEEKLGRQSAELYATQIESLLALATPETPSGTTTTINTGTSAEEEFCIFEP